LGVNQLDAQMHAAVPGEIDVGDQH
jgi:hypothetical protein